MGCFTECFSHCIRLAFLFVLLQLCIWVLTFMHDQYNNRKLIEVDVRKKGRSRTEVDITLCPAPSVNYTSLLETGSTYRSVINRLEGQLFANLTVPHGIGRVFAEMNGCLQDSQIMKATEDLLDRIDMAVSVGCVPKRADQLAERHNQTTRNYLRHLVIDNSHRLLADHFERKDFNFYYSSETFKGIEYFKWDNLTLPEFFEGISINPAKIVKMRPQRLGRWSMAVVHTRHAPSCVRYRIHPQTGDIFFKATLDINGSVCQQSMANTAYQWRRDFCHSKDGVGLLLRATPAQGYRALGGIYQQPPTWLPIDRSSVVEVMASRNKNRDKLCIERRDGGTQHQCLRSCLVNAALGQLDCMLPWLQDADEGNYTGRRLPYCSTYKGAAKALEVSDGLLNHPERSPCWQQCATDCSELYMDVVLAGRVKQPAADQQRTIIITLMGDLEHTTAALLEMPSLMQTAAALVSILAFLSGVSLLSLSQWLLRLTLCLGGARRYLAALRPVCLTDVYLGRAVRRARVAHRWIWRPRPERPWLRPVADRPRSDNLWPSLVRWSTGQTTTGSHVCWGSVLADLDTDSESDSASVHDCKDAVDLQGRLSRGRAAALECLRGGCGQAAEKQVLEEIEAEMAMEEELEQLAKIVSSGRLAIPSSQMQHRSSIHRHSIYGHKSSSGKRRSKVIAMMSSGEKQSGGKMLLSALGGVGTNASRFSTSGHRSQEHRRASIVSQQSSARSGVRKPSQGPGAQGPPPAPSRLSSRDRHPSHERSGRGHQSSDQGHRRPPSFYDMARGHDSYKHSSHSVGSGPRSYNSMVSGHRHSVREMHSGIPSLHEDIRSHMSSLITEVRSRMQTVPGERRDHRSSGYHFDGDHDKHSPHENRRRSASHRRRSHYEDGHDRRPSHYEEGHGRRPSHYEEGHGRRPSHYEDGRGPSRHDQGRRSSRYEDGRRPSNYEDGRRPSNYKDERRHSHYEDGRRPSHYEDGRRSSHYEDGRRSSHYEDGRRTSLYEDGRRHSHYEDGHRPSYHDDGRRPSAYRGQSPSRGRGRGRAGRGRGRGRGSDPGAKPSINPSDAAQQEEHK